MKVSLSQSQIKKVISAFEKKGYSVSIKISPSGEIQFTPFERVDRAKSIKSSRVLYEKDAKISR